MLYRIKGANRHTGMDVTLTIEADTDADARRQAADAGLLISTVTEIQQAPPHTAHAPAPAFHARRDPAPRREPRRAARGRQGGVVTTQRTGKFWKLLTLVGVLSVLIGGGMLAVGLSSEASMPVADGATVPSGELGTAGMGMLLLMLGVPTFIFARLGAWWFHG